jgi:hypothetical protein
MTIDHTDDLPDPTSIIQQTRPSTRDPNSVLAILSPLLTPALPIRSAVREPAPCVCHGDAHQHRAAPARAAIRTWSMRSASFTAMVQPAPAASSACSVRALQSRNPFSTDQHGPAPDPLIHGRSLPNRHGKRGQTR